MAERPRLEQSGPCEKSASEWLWKINLVHRQFSTSVSKLA